MALTSTPILVRVDASSWFLTHIILTLQPCSWVHLNRLLAAFTETRPTYCQRVLRNIIRMADLSDRFTVFTWGPRRYSLVILCFVGLQFMLVRAEKLPENATGVTCTEKQALWSVVDCQRTTCSLSGFSRTSPISPSARQSSRFRFEKRVFNGIGSKQRKKHCM